MGIFATSLKLLGAPAIMLVHLATPIISSYLFWILSFSLFGIHKVFSLLSCGLLLCPPSFLTMHPTYFLNSKNPPSYATILVRTLRRRLLFFTLRLRLLASSSLVSSVPSPLDASVVGIEDVSITVVSLSP